MPLVARNLAWIVGAPVLEQTGVNGIYDISLDFASSQKTTADTYPAIFTALQDQLGLKLESKRAPFDVIVVDRIDKTPGEN